MKPLETVWRSLVQRRLLPVAILLVAALAAIPLLLAKDPKPVATAAPAPAKADEAASASDPLAEPVVSLVSDGDHKERRRVLGARKNPFQPAATPEPTATPAPQTVVPQAQGGTPGVEVTKGDGGTGGTATPPAAPPVATPPVGTPPSTGTRPVHELYSLTVRFGSSEDAARPKRNLPRLKALPSAEEPILVYLGLSRDAKTAVFLVDASAEPQGDGTCMPNHANCETIHLRVGDTEFFDVKDATGNVTAQYQLDLLAIKRRTTASASKAAAARAAESKAGRRVLRARKSASGPLRWRYDAESGTLRKLDKKAYKAAVARVTRAAMASAGAFDVTR